MNKKEVDKLIESMNDTYELDLNISGMLNLYMGRRLLCSFEDYNTLYYYLRGMRFGIYKTIGI